MVEERDLRRIIALRKCGNKKRKESASIMTFPLNIIGMDLSPLVIDDDYEVIDKHQLAEWIAIMMLGQYAHIYMIIEKLSPMEMPSEKALIDYMLSKLMVPSDNQTLIEHRDGWLFQMMSWIALNIKLHADFPGCTIHMAAPHDAPVKHGLDGLALVVTADNKVSRIVITEDKCTKNPQSYIRYNVLPEFEEYEKNLYDNKLISELTQLINPATHIGLYIALSPSFANHDNWSYRIGITRQDAHDNANGRKNLYDGYDSKVSGNVSRRNGASVNLPDLRAWMQDLSDRVCAVLRSKKV